MATKLSQRDESIREVVAHLAGDILQGRRTAGAPLPTHAALAEALSTDESIVREAMRDLRGLHLITAAGPNGEAPLVEDWRCRAELTLLPHYFRHAPAGAEKVNVAKDLLHARRAVLAEVAGQAAERATASDLAVLREIAEAMRDYRGHTTSLLDLDRRFLGALVDATHNPVMRWIANSFLHVYDQVISALPQIWSLPRDHFAYLDELMACLQAHDAEETSAVVRRHLEQTDPLVLAFIRLQLQ